MKAVSVFAISLFKFIIIGGAGGPGGNGGASGELGKLNANFSELKFSLNQSN